MVERKHSGCKRMIILEMGLRTNLSRPGHAKHLGSFGNEKIF